MFAVCYISGTHKLTAYVGLDSPVVRVLQRYEFHTSVCFLPLKCHVSHISVIKMIKMTIVKQNCKLVTLTSSVGCAIGHYRKHRNIITGRAILIIVIFLDFHSAKQGQPLADSWSHGLD